MFSVAQLLAALGLLVAATVPGAAAPAACGLHAYAATVTRVIDGDTVLADIRLGFGIAMAGQAIRLAGIDAPELTGDTARPGALAREALREKVEGEDIILCTLPDRAGEARRDGFGRILGILWRQEDSGYLRNLNVWMVLTGNAEPSWKPLLLRDLLPES